MYILLNKKEIVERIGFLIILGVFLFGGIWSLKYVKALSGKVNEWHWEKYQIAKSVSKLNVIKNDKGINGAGSIPVLLYHGISDEVEDISVSRFNEQMVSLAEAGWRTVSLTELEMFLRGEVQLPEKSMVVSFDDGRKDSYYRSDPILAKLGFRAVMFVITDVPDNDYYLTDEEYWEMLKTGRWELGSHSNKGHDERMIIDENETRGDFFSNKAWLINEHRIETDEEFLSRIEFDLVEAKREIKKRFEIETEYFAYPFGDWGQKTINYEGASKDLMKSVNKHYRLGFYQVWNEGDYWFNYPENQSSVVRISPDNNWSGDVLLMMLENGKVKDINYKDNFSNDHGWTTSWGKSEVAAEKLALKSSENGGGGATNFLNGTYSWRNYRATARVEIKEGESVSIITRLYDRHNYYACNYTKTTVSAITMIDSERTVIWSAPVELNLRQELKIGAEVNDSKMSCLYNSHKLFSVYLGNIFLENGGVGFKVWNSKGESELWVRELMIEEID